jgi:hypothetical protein
VVEQGPQQRRTGAVDEDVDSAERVDRSCDKLEAALLVGDVRRHGDRLDGVLFPELGRDLLQQLPRLAATTTLAPASARP